MKLNTRLTQENNALPEASKAKQQEIELIVKNILSRKQTMPTANTSYMEREIERLVYRLYNLTEEEIALIEGA